MPARPALSDDDLLALFQNSDQHWVAPRYLLERLDASRSTVQRRLIALEAAGRLEVRARAHCGNTGSRTQGRRT